MQGKIFSARLQHVVCTRIMVVSLFLSSIVVMRDARSLCGILCGQFVKSFCKMLDKSSAKSSMWVRRSKRLHSEVVVSNMKDRTYRFFRRPISSLLTPHAPLAPPAPAIPPARLSPLGGLTIPPPFSVPGLCAISLGDAVPLPGTGLLSCGAAPWAWLLRALI